jgi:hypothetical protein
MRKELKILLDTEPVDYNKIKLFLNKYNIKSDNLMDIKDKCDNTSIQIGLNMISTGEDSKCNDVIKSSCNSLFTDQSKIIECK